MGRNLGGRFKREGTYVYLRLIHVDVLQKSTQYYKAIILQLKINKFTFKKVIRQKRRLGRVGKGWGSTERALDHPQGLVA